MQLCGYCSAYYLHVCKYVRNSFQGDHYSSQSRKWTVHEYSCYRALRRHALFFLSVYEWISFSLLIYINDICYDLRKIT